MPFERTKFGNGLAAGVGGSNVVRDVHEYFGAREFNDAQGVIKMEGSAFELTIDLKPLVLRAQAFPLINPVIPALTRITQAYLEVEEVFTLTGTTPSVKIGTLTTEATNGLTLTQAQLQALGMYDITASLAGTWAAAGGLVANTTVGMALAGTTPNVTGNVGRARLLIRYVKL